MPERRYWILFIVLVIVAALFAFVFSFEEPTVRITNINTREISFSTTTIEIGAIINNPNLISANLDKITYKIYFLSDEADWQLLASGEQENISIIANGDTEIDMPLKIRNLQAITAAFQLFFEGANTTIKVNGSAVLDLWVTTYEVPFERIMTIPEF